jgi:hypothetical protein
MRKLILLSRIREKATRTIDQEGKRKSKCQNALTFIQNIQNVGKMSVVGLVVCKRFLRGGDQRLKKVLKVGTKSKKLNVSGGYCLFFVESSSKVGIKD